MKKEIALKWIAALRSGEYKQGCGQLAHIIDNNDIQNSPVRYCCLGVLCEIAVRQGLLKRIMPAKRDMLDINCIAYQGADDPKSALSELPDSVKKLYNMKFTCGDLPFNNSLANINDSGRSFAEIADIIEEYYKEL